MQKPLLSLLGLSFLAACGGTDLVPTASGVFPASGFIGRTMRVEVSGDATTWTSSATVDFGAGVTVSKVDLASPTTLFADITITADAAPGLADVKVTDKGKTVTLTKAFELDVANTLTFQGVPAQGAVALFTLSTADVEHPFDGTQDADGNYVNLGVTAPAGVTLQIGNVGPFSVTGTALFDVDAASGAVTVTQTLLDASTVSAKLEADLAVASRTATALSGTATGSLAKPFETALYTVKPGGAALERWDVTSSNANASPAFAILPASGKWADAVTETSLFGTTFLFPEYTVLAPSAGTYYLVVIEPSGLAGAPFSLRGRETSLTSVAEAANDTPAAAQVVSTLPALVTGASLSSGSDEDWYKLTVPAGKRIHVITGGDDPLTDTVVDVFGPAAGNNAGPSLGGPSSDNGYHEDFVSDATPSAGTYFVQVTASSYFNPSHKSYVAAIVLE